MASIFRRLMKQSSHYFLAEGMVAALGFVSFPILTRVFTREEYGVMSLVSVTLGLSTVIASGGLRPAVIRLYGEYRDKGVERLYSTSFVATAGLAVTAALFLYLSDRVLPGNFLSPAVREFVTFASLLAGVRLLSSMARTFYQAEERSGFYSLIVILEKYLSLGVALTLIIVFSTGLYGLYGAMLVVEGGFALWQLVLVVRRYGTRLLSFSFGVLRGAFGYGLPVLLSNLAAFLMDSGDRYVIDYFLGPEQVGIYSAGYSLATYPQGVVVASINSALIPITMNLWNQGRFEEVKEFLSRILIYLFMGGALVIFGLSAVSREMIVILASAKFEAAAPLVPYVIGGLMLYAGYFPLMAGLYFYKKTHWLALLMWGSAALNLGLNFILVPKVGLLGAAQATFISYVSYLVVGTVVSLKYLRIQIPLFKLAKFFGVGAISFLLMKFLPVDHYSVLTVLVLKGMVGGASYFGLLLFLDSDLRALLQRAALAVPSVLARVS